MSGRHRAIGCLGVLVVTLMTVVGGSSAHTGSAGSPGPAVPGDVVALEPDPLRRVAEPPPAASATRVVPDAAPAPAGMAASRPLAVEIPAIGVDSDLMDLGLQADGSLEVPPGAFPAGWFTGAPTPGERGPAVVVGHVDWATGPGVFARLGALAVGDEIRVRRADGSTAVFRTVEVGRYAKDRFPTDRVYGDIDHAGLRVITCGGAFDERTGHYRDNVVVFAELVVAEAGA